jgi:hypothetical protein
MNLKLTIITTAMVLGTTLAFGQAPDTAAMEEQYKTCAKHFIPADKCTLDVYEQLEAKDNAPLDPDTALALGAAREYQQRLKNPESMQVHTAYVTQDGRVCLDVGGQNSFGGQTVSRVVYESAKNKWRDGTGIFDTPRPGGGANLWFRYCMSGGLLHRRLLPGMDVTDKVNQALKDGK